MNFYLLKLLLWAILFHSEADYSGIVFQLKARILYVDPTTKAIGLTLNPHLIQNKVPPMVWVLIEIHCHFSILYNEVLEYFLW